VILGTGIDLVGHRRWLSKIAAGTVGR